MSWRFEPRLLELEYTKTATKQHGNFVKQNPFSILFSTVYRLHFQKCIIMLGLSLQVIARECAHTHTTWGKILLFLYLYSNNTLIYTVDKCNYNFYNSMFCSLFHKD